MRRCRQNTRAQALLARAITNLNTDTKTIAHLLEWSTSTFQMVQNHTRDLRVKEEIMLILASHYSNEYQSIDPKALDAVLEIARKYFVNVMGDRYGHEKRELVQSADRKNKQTSKTYTHMETTNE